MATLLSNSLTGQLRAVGRFPTPQPFLDSVDRPVRPGHFRLTSGLPAPYLRPDSSPGGEGTARANAFAMVVACRSASAEGRGYARG